MGMNRYTNISMCGLDTTDKTQIICDINLR